MRLRTRLQDELKSRLSAHLPEALGTVWDHAAVLVAVEQLTFKPAGGHEGGWERLAEFQGVVRSELRADRIDALTVEPLIASLVADPVFLDFEAAEEPQQLTEKARIVLAEFRDAIRDQDVVSSLRFTVSGTLARADAPPARPQLLVGQAPHIGAGHEDDYTPIGESAA